ncbi:MAG: type 1 glutamine amidotransferase domain-containing protein [Longimicrobiales bacterium]|nr:type 1 glutamine amidotransferase domain-containing protein [Longimicrobiales bacterium]
MDYERDISKRSVAILATNGFEESELFEPLEALQESGADVKIVSIPDTPGSIRSWAGDSWGRSIDVDHTVDEISSRGFDALVLPGGLMNPDKLRMDEGAVGFVRDFFAEGKPVAAICHGPWLIVEADAAKGRRMTSYPSIRTDLENAGAQWIDDEVVVDQGLVTSRSPEDMESFIDKMLEEIDEGIHAGQHA